VPLGMQSLPRLNEDALARDAARDFYSSANRDKTGPTAVLSARYGLALKQAQNPQAPALGAREAEQSLGAVQSTRGFGGGVAMAPRTSTADSAVRFVQYTQQSQFVNG